MAQNSRWKQCQSITYQSHDTLPYFEHERIKDTIGIRGDPDGLVEWPHVGSKVFWFHGLIDYLQLHRLTAW